MKSTIVACLALVAGVVADSVGSAVVVNKCDYEVYMYNTPASGGGQSEVDKVLAASTGSYTQQWTELTNSAGWSLKLSNSTDLTNILQYEYTFLDDGTIWYDLSEVNGNPWDGDWEITSDSSTCVPKQSAYRYATDDAYGMQSCPQDATITVTLCSGESDDSSSSSSASSSVVAETSSSTSASYSAASSVVATSSESPDATTSETSVASTTLQTSVITPAATTSGSGDVVVTVTQTSTTTTHWTHSWGGPGSKKRDAHHHAARHPHARN